MNNICNDPTRSGPPLDTHTENSTCLSLSEVESLCSKAARGSGMSWGIAEEAGFVAGWLMSRGINGAELLADHLNHILNKPWREIRPLIAADGWRPVVQNQSICPVALGATLSDFLGGESLPLGVSGLRIDSVRCPILLLPFLANLSKAHDKKMSITIGEKTCQVLPSQEIRGDVTPLLTQEPNDIVITTVESLQLEQEGRIGVNKAILPAISSEKLDCLYNLSMHTTVPSSAASRADAGGTGSDSD